jgi:hypothetical protein
MSWFITHYISNVRMSGHLIIQQHHFFGHKLRSGMMGDEIWAPWGEMEIVAEWW